MYTFRYINVYTCVSEPKFSKLLPFAASPGLFMSVSKYNTFCICFAFFRNFLSLKAMFDPDPDANLKLYIYTQYINLYIHIHNYLSVNEVNFQCNDICLLHI